MSYLEIVNLVFTIIYFILGAMTMHFVVFAIAGLFAKKTYPKAKVQHKYGVIIPARNEEAVVGNLIKSVYKNNYPQDKLQVFVIAHNCTDNTAKIARELGATVYEYNNPDECTMGYAFRYLFDRIREDYGVKNYDGFFLFNADNILSADYFEKMNDAFDATGGEKIITSFRNSKNFGTNVMSGLYGMYFTVGCRLESRGRTAVGCSTRVQGTGYVINSKLVENGWKYVTLTEDWEFSADRVINGSKIEFCDAAVFYDEQPTTFKIMWRQRLRWSRGHLLVCVTRFKDLVKSLFSRKKHKNKGSVYDMFVNSMPICAIVTVVGALQAIAYALAPLFGADFGDTMIKLSTNFGNSLLSFYATNFVTAIIVFIAEHKRIKDVSFGNKVLITLFWPLFVLLQFPIDIVAIFKKNLGWKPIPHEDTTNFEALNKIKECEQKECMQDVREDSVSI